MDQPAAAASLGVTCPTAMPRQDLLPVACAAAGVPFWVVSHQGSGWRVLARFPAECKDTIPYFTPIVQPIIKL